MTRRVIVAGPRDLLLGALTDLTEGVGREGAHTIHVEGNSGPDLELVFDSDDIDDATELFAEYDDDKG